VGLSEVMRFSLRTEMPSSFALRNWLQTFGGNLENARETENEKAAVVATDIKWVGRLGSTGS
jgi:hypothetical protein